MREVSSLACGWRGDAHSFPFSGFTNSRGENPDAGHTGGTDRDAGCHSHSHGCARHRDANGSTNRDNSSVDADSGSAAPYIRINGVNGVADDQRSEHLVQLSQWLAAETGDERSLFAGVPGRT